MKIWDVHCHFPMNWLEPDADPAARLESLANHLVKAGIARACLLCSGRRLPRDVSATRMHPFHLDTLANNFPKLKLIGAHLGGTGNYDAAASVARWRPNVFFDMSGGETIEEHGEKRGYIAGDIGVE